MPDNSEEEDDKKSHVSVQEETVTESEKTPPPKTPTPPRTPTPPTPTPPRTPTPPKPPSPITSKPRRPKIRHKGRKYAAVQYYDKKVDFDSEFPTTYSGSTAEDEVAKLLNMAEKSQHRLNKHGYQIIDSMRPYKEAKIWEELNPPMFRIIKTVELTKE